LAISGPKGWRRGIGHLITTRFNRSAQQIAQVTIEEEG
jgi:hypothetical protein